MLQIQRTHRKKELPGASSRCEKHGCKGGDVEGSVVKGGQRPCCFEESVEKYLEKDRG